LRSGCVASWFRSLPGIRITLMQFVTLALQVSLLAVLLSRGLWRRVPWFTAAVASMAIETPFFPRGFYWFESMSAPLRIAAVVEVVWMLCSIRRNRLKAWLTFLASILAPGLIVSELYRAQIQANVTHPNIVRIRALLFTACAVSSLCAAMYCWWSPSSEAPRWSRFHTWILCCYMAVHSIFAFGSPIDRGHWDWMTGLNRSIGFVILCFWITCFLWADPTNADRENNPHQQHNPGRVRYLVEGIVLHRYPSTLSFLAGLPRRIKFLIFSWSRS